jgi:hypothetical protein
VKLDIDSWLQREWKRKPYAMQLSNLIQKVDELLDPYTCSWDDQLDRDLIVEEDAETILAILFMKI